MTTTIVSILLFLASHASTTLIVGTVTDASTGQPLAGVQLYVADIGSGTLSQRDGRYVLVLRETLAPGTEVRLRAQLIGYASRIVVVRVDGRQTRADIALSPASTALEEVVVEAQRFAGPGSAAGPAFNTESYARIEESGFVSPLSSPLSTFSIDVDRASYANVRRMLREGRLPPVDAVRIEELLNYFPYDAPARAGAHPFTVGTELMAAPWRPLHRLLRIHLAAPPVPTADLPPNNLVFLLDVSGSMHAGNKLPLVKRALRLLVDQLRPQDRVAIVVYAGAAGRVLPPTSGSERDSIMDAIERLEAGGSTAGGAGLRLAYATAAESFVRGGNNRVILATDGDFNVGPSSDAEMIRLVEEERTRGVYLTVLGFGRGNLKDSKMEALADHGNGSYAYIDDLLEARKVLVSELGATLNTVASDVKLQVEFNPALVAGYRLIGYENRLLAAEDFNDDRKDAGELGAGHSVTALYEIVPRGSGSDVGIGGIDSLRYQGSEPRAAAAGDELAYVKVRYKRPAEANSSLLTLAVGPGTSEASADFRFAAAVAAWGLVLRDSPFRGGADVGLVAALAADGLADDPHGYRAEFARLVTLTGDLLSARVSDTP